MTQMTFISLFIILSAVSALFTESIKKATKTSFSTNMIALINAIIVGGGGTYVVYIIKNVPFNQTNILYIILMALATWVASMVGYDKVKQTIDQFILK